MQPLWAWHFIQKVLQVNTAMYCRVWFDVYELSNVYEHSFLSSFLWPFTPRHLSANGRMYTSFKYTLTGPDVGESFSVVEGKYSCFALSGALPVQLNKLVSYVDVFKVIIMKVPIFVQNSPVHKHIKNNWKLQKHTDGYTFTQ